MSLGNSTNLALYFCSDHDIKQICNLFEFYNGTVFDNIDCFVTFIF